MSGCNRAAHVRPLVQSPTPEQTPAVAGNSPDKPPDNFGDNAPKTPEEVKEDKASIAVLDKLPDHEMSREEMEKMIADEEKNIPDEPTPAPSAGPDGSQNLIPSGIPSPTPTPAPSVVPDENPGMLTDHTPGKKPTRTEPKQPDPKQPDPKHQPIDTKPSTWPVTHPVKRTPKPAFTPKPVFTPNPVITPKPVVTPNPVVTPKPEVKPEPKVEPSAIPSSTPVVDDGVDADDKKFDETYSGPKTVVDHPRSTPEFQLSEIAAELGSMTPKKKYLELQKSLMGSSLRSCNFFFVAALIQAHVTDSEHFPPWQAASLGSKYFEPRGWKKINLATLKQWFRDGKSFDVAIQRDAPSGMRHGHVAIPVGLNADGDVLVAQASYLTESNKIVTYRDSSLEAKFRIYVRQ